MVNHAVFFSSGCASFLSAMRVADYYGKDNLDLIFADTLIEDEDNYRFLRETVDYIKPARFTWLQDGRTPWQVFNEEKFIGSRQSECSKQLKTKQCKDYIYENYKPDDTILYFGIGMEELERIDKIRKHWKPYSLSLPLCWDSYGWADREKIMSEVMVTGIKAPRLYSMGFSHANCGGFCVKAGQKQFKRLLENLPERYHYHERKEKEWQELTGNFNVAIVRKMEDGVTRGYPLWELRKDLGYGKDVSDQAEGGCGCFIDE